MRLGRFRCPHCGNSKPELIEDNGVSFASPHLSLLCVARLPARECAFPDDPPPADTNGLVACGFMWDPNDGPRRGSEA